MVGRGCVLGSEGGWHIGKQEFEMKIKKDCEESRTLIFSSWRWGRVGTAMQSELFGEGGRRGEEAMTFPGTARRLALCSGQ